MEVGWGDDELSSEHSKFEKFMGRPSRDERHLAVCVDCHKNVSTSRHLFQDSNIKEYAEIVFTILFITSKNWKQLYVQL